MPIQVQEASTTSNRHDQTRTSPQHVIAKTISTGKNIEAYKREKANNI
jgi:hypothetical protein